MGLQQPSSTDYVLSISIDQYRLKIIKSNAHSGEKLWHVRFIHLWFLDREAIPKEKLLEFRFAEIFIILQ